MDNQPHPFPNHIQDERATTTTHCLAERKGEEETVGMDETVSLSVLPTPLTVLGAATGVVFAAGPGSSREGRTALADF